MQAPRRQIPPDRKALYYGGLALSVVGLLLFLSVFVSAATNFGNFDNFPGQVQSSMFRALGGMALVVAGGVMRSVGARGWAGSGVVLDPELARKDIEPWSRMGGGVVDDALSEVGVVKAVQDRLAVPAPAPAVKVRCRACQALNDEAAKFCNQCGAAV